MAVSGITPFIHVEDSNGNPYVAANLYVYDVGTTTKKSIYSDTGLSVALTNPLVSDSAGNFSRFYMAAGSYKLRAETAAGTLIWQFDNIDTLLGSGSGALPIASGGTSATTAATARTALGAAAQTDVDTLSDDIATISASLQNIVSVPQGRLTPTTATPVISTGVTAGTAVYYTPYIGNLIPVYDGAQFNATEFAELTLTLSSNHLASQIYDVFIWSESGTVTIGTGPAWTTATAGAGARGTGAGTTELTRTNGLLTNANSMTTRNGSTTYTVNANRGLYVGSIYMDGTNGQITCHTVWGQSRKFGIWNAFNQAEIALPMGDSTASWTVSNTAAFAQSNSAAGNTTAVFCGLADAAIEIVFRQNVTGTGGVGVSSRTTIGIGVNSTTTASGVAGFSDTGAASGNYSCGGMATANYSMPPSLGLNNINSLQKASSGGGTHTALGGNDDMVMVVRYRG